MRPVFRDLRDPIAPSLRGGHGFEVHYLPSQGSLGVGRKEVVSMKNVLTILAIGLLGMAGTANAGGLSYTVTGVSDYDFRGVSLSATDPALQASVDYASDSGFYAGAWVSNIDYGSSIDGDVELDLYGGWTGEFAEGVGWDAGIVWYTYPDSSSSATKGKIFDYPEIYASVSKGPFKFKQWYTNDYGGTEQDALYSEIGLSFPMSNGFSLNLHTGYNFGEYWNNAADENFDFSVGVGYSVSHFNLGLKYTTTGLEGGPFEVTNNEFTNTGRVVFSIATTFPWSDE
jgi:uncharacterized protein (TIGR02001 family)